MTPTKTARERFEETFSNVWFIPENKERYINFIETLLEEARQEMKEKCAKKAFDFAENLEKKTWVDASYARAVWNLISSL